MSIASEISRLQEAKADLKTAIEGKGVTVPTTTTLDGYADLVDAIEQGGGEDEDKIQVHWLDYDGTELKVDTVQSGGSATAPTNVPAHQHLVFKGWGLGSTLTNITESMWNIARYETDDDNAVYYKVVTDDYVQNVTIVFTNNNASTDIDWGDGSEVETYARQAQSRTIYHSYNGAFTGFIKISSTVGFSAGGQRQLLRRCYNEIYYGNNTQLGAYCVGVETIAVILPNSASPYKDQNYSLVGCSSLRALVIQPECMVWPSGKLTSDASSLIAVNIPNNITSIGNSAFTGASNLRYINFNTGITQIGSNAFDGTSALNSIINLPNLQSLGGGNNRYCFRKSGIKKILNLGSITKIYNETFLGCDRLESVVLPSTLTDIDTGAFNGCSRIKTMTIPQSVTSIGGNAFRGLYEWEGEINLPNLTNMGSTNSPVFNNCRKLKKVINLGSITNFFSDELINCYELESIHFPSTIISFQANTVNLTRDGKINSITCDSGWVLPKSINFADTSCMSVDAVMVFINALGDNTGGTTKTIGVGVYILGRLTAEQLAAATAKNYSIIA